MDARTRDDHGLAERWPLWVIKYAFVGWEWRKREFWPYAYYTDGKTGWMMWSSGPDGIYDITDPAEVYDPKDLEQPSPRLINLIYDPTNGYRSRGDVVRFKQ